jgi:hypothetical protein
MNPTAEILIAIAIAALAPGFLVLFNEKRKRRLSEARLALAKLATEANRQMLAGETKRGDICHDRVYASILGAQHSSVFNVDWNPLHNRVSEEGKKFQEALRQELELHPKRAGLIDSFTHNLMKAFRNSHPVKFRLFWLWVILFCGGLRILGLAFRAAIHGAFFTARGMRALSDGWQKCKMNIRDWALLYNIHGDPDCSAIPIRR